MMREINDLEYLNYTIGQSYNLVVSLRIRGKLTKELLSDVFLKLQQRHPLLKVRMLEKDGEAPWFTSEGVEEIPITVIKRENDQNSGHR